MINIKTIFLALTLGSAVGLMGCGGSSGNEGKSGTTGTLPNERAPATTTTSEAHAPCVVLRDVQPDNTQIEQCIRTRPENIKYLLLDFFSVTCSDCQANMPILSRLSDDVQATAATRLVAIDHDEALIRTYIQDTPKTLVHFPVALDTGRDAKKAYGVVTTPTLFVLDKDNQVLLKHEGILSPKDVDTIKSLVSQ